MEQPQLTAKGAQTRRHIFNTAIELITTKGYEQTTMRDIAEKADCSLGLTYRYFASKDDLVLELYRTLGTETVQEIEALEANSMADRFHQAMLDKLEQITPYRDALAALIGQSMNPNTKTSLVGDYTVNIRQLSIEGFRRLVFDSKDALNGDKGEQMAKILYVAHMGIILFWLYDRTPDYKATHRLLHLIHDLFKMARPMLFLPIFTKALSGVAEVLEPVFLRLDVLDDEVE